MTDEHSTTSIPISNLIITEQDVNALITRTKKLWFRDSIKNSVLILVHIFAICFLIILSNFLVKSAWGLGLLFFFGTMIAVGLMRTMALNKEVEKMVNALCQHSTIDVMITLLEVPYKYWHYHHRQIVSVTSHILENATLRDLQKLKITHHQRLLELMQRIYFSESGPHDMKFFEQVAHLLAATGCAADLAKFRRIGKYGCRGRKQRAMKQIVAQTASTWENRISHENN